jgi:integrase
MREKRLDAGTQHHYLAMLGDYLAYHKNGAVGIMKAAFASSWPRPHDKPIRSLTIDQVNAVIAAAEALPGWEGQVARFVTLMYAVTAARPGELRHAKLKDLELDPPALRISNPKGDGVYGDANERVSIDLIYRDKLVAFLEAREEYLRARGADCDFLVPYVYMHSGAGPWSEGLWGELAGRIRALTPFKWSWRTFRASHAQIYHDVYGVSIEDCSARLRHQTTTTTQRYYAQINKGLAQRRIDAAVSEARAAGAPAIGLTDPAFQTEPVRTGVDSKWAHPSPIWAHSPLSWLDGETEVSLDRFNFSFDIESAEALA